jgi:hypothetical protein
MTGGLSVGGDVERPFAKMPVPSYVLDTGGVVRWINPPPSACPAQRPEAGVHTGRPIGHGRLRRRVAMQKVVGSSPIIRSKKRPWNQGLFR